MKWYRFVSVMCAGVLLLGSLMVSPALAIITNTVNDQIPGSFLVYPIFDVNAPNRTLIELVNRGAAGVNVHMAIICQSTDPLGPSLCPTSDADFALTHNQTIVIDVESQFLASVTCASGQGYIVAWAEALCTTAGGCPTATGGTIGNGEFGPISYNQLYGSYYLYYNGGTSPAGLTCGGRPCAPPPIGPIPDVEAANAIAFESYHPIFSFIGNTATGRLVRTFGSTAASDYVALGAHVQTSFTTPGSAISAGPTGFPPGNIIVGPSPGTELQTNIILLNLNVDTFELVSPSSMSVNSWNWFEVGFSAQHFLTCWERIPINLIDPRLIAGGPFAAPTGQIRFTPSTASNPQLLGAIEAVTSVGRTIRNLIHSGTAAVPATFVIQP